MTKQALGIRERRKIYEDTINIIAQNQKIGASTSDKDRAMRTVLAKQNDRCMSILTTILGCQEKTVEDDSGTRNTSIVVPNGKEGYIIDKKQLETLVQQLPKNKELRESLWALCIKGKVLESGTLDAFIFK
jgi:hypothetical protein